MKIKNLIIMMLAFLSITFAQQQGDYSKEPGYFDFGDITSLKDGEMVTEIYLEEPLLKMIAKMGESQNEGIGQMIETLKLVKVNEFMVEKRNYGKFEDSFSSMHKELQTKKWNRIIKIKHADTFANVYVKGGSADDFVGLVIVAMDKQGKAVLVNIVGKIDLETIGKLSEQFDFPDVNKMKEKGQDKEEK